jgi:chromosome segregation ATPase
MSVISRNRLLALPLLLAAFLCTGAAAVASPQSAQREYLTQTEADKIRDAELPSLRIKLFLEFAADRLKKFQYELTRPSSERLREERLNSLLNAYSGCVDDAADLMSLGREKQQDIRAGIKEAQKRLKEFLPQLEKLAAEGQDLALYKETLVDAIEATKSAMDEADKAAKELAPAPVRRRPS